MEINNQEYWKNYWKQEKNEKIIPDYIVDNWLEAHRKELDKIENREALDLGCGLGQDTKYLMEQGFKVISTDIAKEALEQLKKKIPNSQIMQVDMAEVLPFETERFGLINANLSMHYFSWKITEQIFSEIKRILKPKGILILLLFLILIFLSVIRN